MGIAAALQFDWTDENVATLKRRWAAGESASQVAAQFGSGLSRSAVLGKVMRLGLSRIKMITHHPKPPHPRQRAGEAGGTTARIRSRIAHDATNRGEPEIKRLPLPKELPADAIPIAQRKQLLDLDNGTCRWPFGTPGHSDFFYCGSPDADNVAGRVYCPFHTRRAAA